MFTNSIRWRLQLWLAFLLVCILAGFGMTVFQLHRTHRFDQLDEELKRRVATLSVTLRTPPWASDRGERPPFENDLRLPPPRRPRPDSEPPRDLPNFPSEHREVQLSTEAANLFSDTTTNSFYFVIWSRGDNAIRSRSTNAPPELPQPERPGKDTTLHLRTRGNFREAFHYTERGDSILAGRSITADLNATRRFAEWLIAAGVAVLAFGLGGGWWLTTNAIRPVEKISAAASRISAGNLSERIKTDDSGNELGRLAGVLNSTFARLETAFAQQKQFTADASHELRTPLAIIISEAQTTLARERSATEYRETVQACLGTAQQMRRLTESLLDLARFDSDQEKIPRDPIDLAQITQACTDGLRPLAEKRGLIIHCHLAPAKIFAHMDRINQIITNLLTNAIHYNKPGGEIRLSTRVENGMAVLTVIDTGLGIAPEDLPYIFDRFYRADKSRSSAEGRSGLGLAICKAAIESESGQIEVASQISVGTTFTVRFPEDKASRI